jgi:3-methyladenine DNA glycosylase Tag
MTPFRDIYESAILLRDTSEVESRNCDPKPDHDLRSMPDNEFLSLMSRRIFRAGLKHSMVDAKWPVFEQVFSGFDIHLVGAMSDEDLDLLMKDRRIIRHWNKIKSVRFNAQAMAGLLENSDGFGSFLADWPVDNIVGLWLELKKHFAQLGGNSAPYFLRMSGKDTFLLTNDVIRALNRWGAYQGEPKSQKARLVVQECFNTWKQESNRPLCQISVILALSIQ